LLRGSVVRVETYGMKVVNYTWRWLRNRNMAVRDPACVITRAAGPASATTRVRSREARLMLDVIRRFGPPRRARA
jgi:hypothetical protein